MIIIFVDDFDLGTCHRMTLVELRVICMLVNDAFMLQALFKIYVFHESWLHQWSKGGHA